MAPRADASSGNENFLITCLKCAKAKPEVDLDAVAKAMGMSRGGVGNKFRTLMRQFEDEGAMWTNAGTGNGEKTAPKRKATSEKPATRYDAKGEDDDDSAPEEKPPAKKAKARPALRKKGTATAKEKKVASASEGESEDGDKTAAGCEPGK